MQEVPALYFAMKTKNDQRSRRWWQTGERREQLIQCVKNDRALLNQFFVSGFGLTCRAVSGAG